VTFPKWSYGQWVLLLAGAWAGFLVTLLPWWVQVAICGPAGVLVVLSSPPVRRLARKVRRPQARQRDDPLRVLALEVGLGMEPTVAGAVMREYGLSPSEFTGMLREVREALDASGRVSGMRGLRDSGWSDAGLARVFGEPTQAVTSVLAQDDA
jgi:hypothetical protein